MELLSKKCNKVGCNKRASHLIIKHGFLFFCGWAFVCEDHAKEFLRDGFLYKDKEVRDRC